MLAEDVLCQGLLEGKEKLKVLILKGKNLVETMCIIFIRYTWLGIKFNGGKSLNCSETSLSNPVDNGKRCLLRPARAWTLQTEMAGESSLLGSRFLLVWSPGLF